MLLERASHMERPWKISSGREKRGAGGERERKRKKEK